MSDIRQVACGPAHPAGHLGPKRPVSPCDQTSASDFMAGGWRHSAFALRPRRAGAGRPFSPQSARTALPEENARRREHTPDGEVRLGIRRMTHNCRARPPRALSQENQPFKMDRHFRLFEQ
jgi:hypothetical protein